MYRYSRSQTDYGYPLKEKKRITKIVPRPYVEEEADSLLRESHPVFPCYDPPCRGTINQDPIIIETEIRESNVVEQPSKACREENKSHAQSNTLEEDKTRSKTSSTTEDNESFTNESSSTDTSGNEIKHKPRKNVQIMSSRSTSPSTDTSGDEIKHKSRKNVQIMSSRSSSSSSKVSEKPIRDNYYYHEDQLSRQSSPRRHHVKIPRESTNTSPQREGRLVHKKKSRKELSRRHELGPHRHRDEEKRLLKNPPPLSLKRRDPNHHGSNLQLSNLTTPNDEIARYHTEYPGYESGHYPEVGDYRSETLYPPVNPAPYVHDLAVDYPNTMMLDNMQPHNFSYISGTYMNPPAVPYAGLSGGYGAPYVLPSSTPAYDGLGVQSAYPTPSNAIVERDRQPYHPQWQRHTYESSPVSDDRKIIRHPGKIITPLPPCPRTKFSQGKTDWLTLPHCPNFDICTFCFESSIAPTEFEKFFITSPRPTPNTKTLCDFGSSPWYRIAWLTILTKNLKSISLFYELAEVAQSVPPCPEGEKTVGYWWSIIDPWTGRIMPGLKICLNCVNSIEVFFPVLRGVFVCTENFDPWPCACDLRTTKNRFIQFFDTLEIMAAEAEAQGLPPDTRLLAKLNADLKNSS